jgi:hypothetical protein
MRIDPWLDIDAARNDAAHNVRDLIRALATLLTLDECQSPPRLPVVGALGNSMALLELLDALFPPACVAAIATERAQWEEDEKDMSRG